MNQRLVMQPVVALITALLLVLGAGGTRAAKGWAGEDSAPWPRYVHQTVVLAELDGQVRTVTRYGPTLLRSGQVRLTCVASHAILIDLVKQTPRGEDYWRWRCSVQPRQDALWLPPGRYAVVVTPRQDRAATAQLRIVHTDAVPEIVFAPKARPARPNPARPRTVPGESHPDPVLYDERDYREIPRLLRAMPELTETAWQRLTLSTRLAMLQDIENRVAALQQRPPARVSLMPSHGQQGEARRTVGEYLHTTRSIRLDREMLDDRDISLDTLFHEIRHAVQHHVAEGPEGRHPQRDAWRRNLARYHRTTDDYRAYHDQPVEVDARLYARTILERAGLTPR